MGSQSRVHAAAVRPRLPGLSPYLSLPFLLGPPEDWQSIGSAETPVETPWGSEDSDLQARVPLLG